MVTDSVIHAHKRPHIIRSSTHRKYQSTIQHSSKFKFLRGHRLPPNRCHRFRHPRAQTTPHHSIIHAQKMIVYLAPNKFQISKGSPPPTQSWSQIPSSTHTNDPTSFDHPHTANTSPHPALVKIQISKGSPPPTHRLRTPTTPTITHLHNTPRTPSPTHYGFGGTCER